MKIFRELFQRDDGSQVQKVSEAPTTAKSASYGVNSVVVNGHGTALSVAAFHRAVEVRAKTMSQLLFEYQRMSKAGGNFTAYTSGEGKAINYLLQVRPNPMMTASTLMQQAEINKMLHGNAYIYVEREAGVVRALWLCTCGSYNIGSNTYNLQYNSTRGTVSLADVPSTDVLHICNTFRDYGGYLGLPTLTYASKVLSIAATNDLQTLDNAAKGGKMKLIVQEERKPSMTISGRASKKAMEDLADKLRHDIYNDDIIVLDNVATVTPISQNAQQMELLESRKFSVREIARLTGVPPVLLMDDSNSSYKSPEAATQEFLLRTIQPAIREWEDELNSKLLTPDEFGRRRYHLCSQLLHRLDPQGQANLDKIRLETGVKSVNELRAQYDLPTIDGGDLHYLSTNMAELGSNKLSNNGAPTKGEEGGEE